MDKKTSDRKATSNFLTRKLETPVWLLTAIAVALILAGALRITIPNLLLALIAIILIVIGLLPNQKGLTSEVIKELSDSDSSGHKITVSNFPNYANPTLLKINDREALKKIEADAEIGGISSIAGDLVFEVNRFETPVQLVLNYTEEDEQALVKRQEILKRQGAQYQEVNLIPVYLETTVDKDGKSTTTKWRAFKETEYKIDPTNKRFTIEVSKWGDQNIGVGTKP